MPKLNQTLMFPQQMIVVMNSDAEGLLDGTFKTLENVQSVSIWQHMKHHYLTLWDVCIPALYNHTAYSLFIFRMYQSLHAKLS